jgi:hypothetical protein
MVKNSAFAFALSLLKGTLAGRLGLTRQQSTRESAMVAVAFSGMFIALQPASVLELEPKQSPVVQREAEIGAASTKSARNPVISLCHDIRVCTLAFIVWTKLRRTTSS